MKAKSRRRLLLSSVAMLLVAVLALGTATFAWFTNSDTAKATNAQVKATAPSGFQICAVQAGASTTNAVWGDDLNLNSFFSNQLQPVSFNPNGTSTSFSIYQTNMTSGGVVTAINGTTVDTNSPNKIPNLIAIDIYGRLTGAGTKAVSFKLDLSDPKSDGNAMRCAVYGVDGSRLSNKLLYHLGKDNSDFTTTSGYRACNPLKSAGTGLTLSTSNGVIPTSYSDYVAGQIRANNVKTYSTDTSLSVNVTSTQVLLGRFLFWVEGQDPYCKDANQRGLMTLGTGNFTLNFKVADAS